MFPVTSNPMVPPAQSGQPGSQRPINVLAAVAAKELDQFEASSPTEVTHATGGRKRSWRDPRFLDIQTSEWTDADLSDSNPNTSTKRNARVRVRAQQRTAQERLVSQPLTHGRETLTTNRPVPTNIMGATVTAPNEAPRVQRYRSTAELHAIIPEQSPGLLPPSLQAATVSHREQYVGSHLFNDINISYDTETEMQSDNPNLTQKSNAWDRVFRRKLAAKEPLWQLENLVMQLLQYLH